MPGRLLIVIPKSILLFLSSSRWQFCLLISFLSVPHHLPLVRRSWFCLQSKSRTCHSLLLLCSSWALSCLAWLTSWGPWVIALLASRSQQLSIYLQRSQTDCWAFFCLAFPNGFPESKLLAVPDLSVPSGTCVTVQPPSPAQSTPATLHHFRVLTLADPLAPPDCSMQVLIFFKSLSTVSFSVWSIMATLLKTVSSAYACHS